MIYIIDSNKDKKRKLPNGLHKMGDERVICQLGSVVRLMALTDCDGLPGWQKFATEGKAGIRTIRKMIKECELDEDLKTMCLEGLKVAVPPIAVAQD